MRNAQCLVLKLVNAMFYSDNDFTTRHLTELLSKGAKGAAKFCSVAGKILAFQI